METLIVVASIVVSISSLISGFVGVLKAKNKRGKITIKIKSNSKEKEINIDSTVSEDEILRSLQEIINQQNET